MIDINLIFHLILIIISLIPYFIRLYHIHYSKYKNDELLKNDELPKEDESVIDTKYTQRKPIRGTLDNREFFEVRDGHYIRYTELPSNYYDELPSNYEIPEILNDDLVVAKRSTDNEESSETHIIYYGYKDEDGLQELNSKGQWIKDLQSSKNFSENHEENDVQQIENKSLKKYEDRRQRRLRMRADSFAHWSDF